MKGGVTSGLVYPGAIRVLATRYRFRHIGGTSAGAIAAALTAAAEYRRREGTKRGDPDAHAGFDRLWQLADSLQRPAAGGRTRLEALFAPNPGTRAPFALLSAVLRPGGRLRRVAGALARHFPLPSLLTAGGAGLTLWAGVRAVRGEPPTTALPGLTLTAAGLGWLGGAVVRSALRGLQRNGYGLSRGYEAGKGGAGEDGADDASAAPRFTPWLHREIQDLAGKAASEPLTFGDLDPQVGNAQVGESGEHAEDAIDLRLMTTCVTLERPYVLPMDSGATDDKQFYFRPQEWRGYFPAGVVDFLMSRSERQVSFGGAAGDGSPPEGKWEYYRLPPPRDLPVIVATRLSMSFPLLFSAVPLHLGAALPAGTMDDPEARPAWTRRARPGGVPLVERVDAAFRPCLFSDGGLTSNFPLTLFDDLVPTQPTFALNLEYDRTRRRGGEPAAERPPYATPILPIRAFGQPETARASWRPRPAAIGTPWAFGLSLFESARNWFDHSLIPLTGYAERIAHVPLYAGQGGLNLGMSPAQIGRLRYKGLLAGQALLNRFDAGTNPPGWTWTTFQATHFIGLTADLEDLLARYSALYRDPQTGGPLLPGLGGVRVQDPERPGDYTLGVPELAPHTAPWARARALLELGHAPRQFGGFRRLRGKRALLRYRPVL
ncbi:patatin-like phospholipase family protein [Deinococcus sp. YIM 134068]|uniref:patatin-like phospholipase family protein n=1 Tax=Deinococcus lichenicola TaxID=3118910 RepID=UPI002F94F278